MNYSALREKAKVTPLNGGTEGMAYLTHYLQNQTEEYGQVYKSQAVSYANENLIDLPLSAESYQHYLPIQWDVPFPPPQNPSFTFIDLFAGIGGFRIPLQELGGKCVFTSEFNPQAQRSYDANFGEVPFGDITKIDLDIVPKHDILCAGFPCQPFSISGKMKGFEDTRGTLIYHVFELIEKNQPKVVFLENVKHLVHHDKGKTLKTIIQHLEELGYVVSKKVLNASDFGVPQNRERIIIIGHKEKEFKFSKLSFTEKMPLKHFLDSENDFEYLNEPYTILDRQTVQESGLIFAGYRNKKIRVAGVRPGTEHLSRVHKQPNRIYSSEGVHPALPSQEASGRFWIYHEGKVRKLTINECYRIMGFPDEFILVNNKAEQYKQIGNSVCIPMIKAIGQQILNQLLNSPNFGSEPIYREPLFQYARLVGA
jgi:DNA (cytosine-5)-methyltransferase 1